MSNSCLSWVCRRRYAISGIVVVLLVQIVANLRRRQSPSMLSLVALAASAIVLLHALVDFSLQIQAIAITYWALLGAGLHRAGHEDSMFPRHAPAERWRLAGHAAVIEA